jgi:hypothetical protein
MRPRGVVVGVFTRDYEPTRGRCPACREPQDTTGCRVLAAWRLGPTLDREAEARSLSAEHRALQALLDHHPYVMDAACCDPGLLAEQDAWDRAHRVR